MIKQLIRDIRVEIGQLLFKGGPGSYFDSFFDMWEAAHGKWQDTDFKSQVKKNKSWVYACTSAISESVAKVPINLYVERNGKREPVEDHIFWDMWREVNPFMNNFLLRELTEIYLLLTGNAYWYVVKNVMDVPIQIWPVPAQFMKIVPDKIDFIKGYLYQPPGQDETKFEVKDIIHFKYPNPSDAYYGLGTLAAAIYEADMNESMNEYQTSIFRNQGIPEGTLESDQPLNNPIRERMKLEWNQRHQGPEKAGKIAILEKGLKYKQIQMSARELAYIQSKNVNRDTILGIFRVPPSILGMVENVNRNNAEAMEYTFALHNISPKVTRNQEKLNEQLMPMYPQDRGGRLVIEYDDPVPENREQAMKEQESRLKSGYSTINQEREADGLSPVKWGDVPIMPINVAPLGSVPVKGTSNPPKKTGDPKPVKTKTVFSRERAAILYIQRFAKEVNRFVVTLKELFKDQEKEVLANVEKFYKGKALTKDAADAFLFVRAEAEKKFVKAGRPHEEGAYEAGAKHGIRLADLGIDFNLNNPVAQTYLEEKTFRFSFQVNDTTINELRKELNEGMAAGENIKDISDRVKKVFDFADNTRATRIARTEIAEVENKATEDMWLQSEVVEEKEWLHGGGGLEPRPEHANASPSGMNGQRVKIGERFSNRMMRPGDPAGGVGEIANCTCSLLPHVKE